MGLDAGRARRRGGGFERLVRRGDQVRGVAAEHAVARLGSLEFAALEPGPHVRRHLDRVAVEGSRARRRRWWRPGTVGPLAMTAGSSPRHVADRERHQLRGRAGRRELAALDARQVLAHAVHFADVGAGFQQLPVDALLVGQRQALGRQREQGRAAARDQAQHQIVGGQPPGQRQDALGRLQPGFVRHRVGRLDQFDAAGQTGGARRDVVIARHHQPGQRRIGRPQGLQRLRHGTARLAGAQDQRPAPGRRCRQVCAHAGQRQRALDRHAVEMFQKRARRASCVGHGAAGALIRCNHLCCLQCPLCCHVHPSDPWCRVCRKLRRRAARAARRVGLRARQPDRSHRPGRRTAGRRRRGDRRARPPGDAGPDQHAPPHVPVAHARHPEGAGRRAVLVAGRPVSDLGRPHAGDGARLDAAGNGRAAAGPAAPPAAIISMSFRTACGWTTASRRRATSGCASSRRAAA